MNANDLIKVIVVVTMCLALLGIIGMVYVGKVDAGLVVTFVLTTFSTIVGGAGAVGLTQYGTKQGVTTALSILKAESK